MTFSKAALQAAAGLAVVVAAGLAAPVVASAAGPTFERVAVDETFADDFLTEACGVPVTTTLSGEIITRTFSGEGTGVAEVRTISLSATATAGDRTFRFRDVGADLVRIEPDGTAVLLVTGQVPFAFAGALMIDIENDEAILEPRDRSAEQIEAACAALTG